jgi:hypothetical protein
MSKKKNIFFNEFLESKFRILKYGKSLHKFKKKTSSSLHNDRIKIIVTNIFYISFMGCENSSLIEYS